MINSEMIRINELVNITSAGFIVKLYSTVKIPSKWSQILNEFTENLKSRITLNFEDETRDVPQDPSILSRLLEEVKLLQHNDSARGIIQVPYCSAFSSLHSLMSVCLTFCDLQEISLSGLLSGQPGMITARIGFSATRMSLEQAFLAYASYQTQNNSTLN